MMERTQKSGSRSSGRRPGEVKRGIRRHLEGWELGVIAVGIAVLALALAMPRGAEPDVIPLPHVDRPELARVERVERERADLAEAERLPYEVRATGEAQRQYGRAEADGNVALAAARRTELRRTATLALSIHGAEPLLRLRAAQTRLFERALARWESGSDATAELEELGGAFVEKARAAGWLAGRRRLDISAAERAALFRIRWGELTGLRDEQPFASSANEWRLYYRFLLEHPDATAPADAPLRYVEAAQKYDPSYPGLLARGILELRLGRPQKAALTLQSYLAAKRDGPWRLRAQNHLALAVARTSAPAQP